MTFVVKDRVRETSTTTGTGSFTLSGAVQGFQSFSVIGDSNTTFYAIVNPQVGEWEVGVGTYTLATTSLSRDVVLESSNSGALVNFSAGEKDVIVTYPAEKALYVNDFGSAIVNNLSLSTNEITSTQASDNILITPTGIGALKVQNRITLEDRMSWGSLENGGSYLANNAEYIQNGLLSSWRYLQNGDAVKYEYDNQGLLTAFTTSNGTSGNTVNAWTEVFNISLSGAITNGSWQGNVIDSAYGGTGLSNVGATLDITGNASISGVNTGDQVNIVGNAGTATALQTARTINGVAFDGTANITIATATPNNLTIASPLTGGSFNGSAPATIGLPTANSTVTGALSSTDWATFNAKQAALSGAGIVKSTNGTISYLTDNTANWGTAYNRSLTSATVTGTTTKTLTLNQQGGTNITASWSDLNTDAVTSVFGRTGAVVATEGDYSLTQLSDVNLTSPTNGQLLQNNGTQWVNWTPNYLTANQVVTLSGDVTGTGATAITATLANTTVTAGTYGNATQAPQITIDSKGRATSAGNVTITPAWSSVTGTPTTISGYGITNGVTLTGAQTLTNKTFTDSSTFFQDNLDNTKKAQFELSNISTATTRTYTLPNVNGTLITNQDYTANDVLTKIKTVDGTGSGLDADTLDGYELATAVNQGPTFPCIPLIKSDGVMEVGRYLDFHSSSNDGIDYSVRLDTENTTRVFTLPSASGRLIGSGDTATVTNTMLAGSIANSKLNTITTAGKVANSATTATNLNTVNTIVSRDASGNFQTNKITLNSGTFSAPSLVIGANTNTGLYSSAANSLDFTVNSIRRVAIDTEGFKSFGSGNINTNSAIGANSLIANTTGFQNTAIGVEALKSNTTGFSNTGLGAYSLSTNTTGNNNTAVGIAALQKQTTADGNTAVGLACLQETTTGFYNTSIGGYGLFFNTTGNNNTAIGYASSYNNTTGIYNTAIGVNSLYSNITTNYNTAIGAGALINNTGSGNSALGSQYTSSGVYDPAFNITTQNNLLSLGHKLITTAYINVSWTIVSDARDKTNFAKVPYGIDFVKKLKPVSYERKIKREEEKGDGKVRYGFLAQDILELEGDKPVLVDNNDKEHLYLNENSLIPILVNAIQELQQQIEELKNA